MISDFIGSATIWGRGVTAWYISDLF
jgi:hypothetical protein